MVTIRHLCVTVCNTSLSASERLQHDFRPKTFLFPGQSSNWPLGQSSIQEAIKVSARMAKITKVVTHHTLRHSYATALLEAHAHVHAVVPGGGPALVGGHWKDATAPDGRPKGWYLVDAVTLRRTFREHFIKGLRRLFAEAELKLEGEFAHLLNAEQQEALLADLERVEWVSYIEPPPHEGCRPELVLKYLARYLTGGPISDGRIVSADERQVTFLAREGKVTGGQREQVPMSMSAVEFTRLWPLHILPKGFTKSRRFGGWSNPRKEEYVQACAMLLEDTTTPLPPEALSFDTAALEQLSSLETDCERCKCPKCGAAMSEIAASLKPSWHDVMNSPHRPNWYSHIRLRL